MRSQLLTRNSRLARWNQRRPIQVEMTPMIDVVFLLLIFFLWTASFRMAEQLLPSRMATEARTRGSEQDMTEDLDFEPVVVRVLWQSQSPSWTVNGRAANSLQMVFEKLSKVAAIKSDVPVIVDPEPTVPLGHAIEVYDLSREIGFGKVQFAADWK